MSLPSCLADPRIPIVVDASVVINLNATACAAAILQCLPNPFRVTTNVFAELSQGEQSGHDDAAKLRKLTDQGAFRIVRLGDPENETYRSLIEGRAADTLDDGEAATIAYAVKNHAIALIDERKATRLCSQRFPSLVIVSTVDLLLHPEVAVELGERGQRDAVLAALLEARMSVPQEHIGRVVNLIGSEQAASCPSLPRPIRTPS